MRFELTILGSNSALPTPDRNSSAQLLNINERFFLIDCGEGTQIQLRKYKQVFSKINNIFISHLHGDHFFGLPGLISSFGLLGRKTDLNIYGPVGLEKIIDCLMSEYQDVLSFKINFYKTNPKKVEKIYEDKEVIVKSFPLKHRVETTGFYFTEKLKDRNIIKEKIEEFKIPVKKIPDIKKGADFITDTGEIIKNKEITKPPKKPRAYAYCSDTAYTESIIDIIKNVDILYHEATFADEHKSYAEITKHSTAKQAAKIAKKANAKMLLIGHFSPRYKSVKILENEAKEIFENTIAVFDGDVYSA
jgi:ribonuclease Z